MPRSKIYAVGVPLRYENVRSPSGKNFRKVIETGLQNQWPFYSTSKPEDFFHNEVIGYKYIQELGIRPKNLSRFWYRNGVRMTDRIIKVIISLITFHSSPIILLRHGSPLVGDVLIAELKKMLGNQLVVLDTESGPDLVASKAESELGIPICRRKHMECQKFNEMPSKKFISEDLIVINCISQMYCLGPNKRSLIGELAERMVALGFRKNSLFLKSPGHKGLWTTPEAFKKELTNYNPYEHYTAVLFTKH